MTTENIEAAIQEVAEASHETAAEVIEQAQEVAAETHETAAEAVEHAAEAVETLTDEVTDKQKELEWKLLTQNQLAELTQKVNSLSTLPEAMQSNHQAIMAQLTQATTPPPEAVADLPEIASEALQDAAPAPESQAEQQSQRPKRRAVFL